MSSGFRSIELARKLYGLSGEEQQAFLSFVEWANENEDAKKYLRLYTKGEITREQLMEACGEIRNSK